MFSKWIVAAGLTAATVWGQSALPNRVATAQGTQKLSFGSSGVFADGQEHPGPWVSLRKLQLRTNGKGTAALIDYNAILTMITAPTDAPQPGETYREVNGYVEVDLMLLVDGVVQYYALDLPSQDFLVLDSVGLTLNKAAPASSDVVLAFVQGARSMKWVVPGLSNGVHTFEIRGRVQVSGFAFSNNGNLMNVRLNASAQLQRDVVIAEEIAVQP